MKMRKRITIVAVMLCAALLFTACNAGSDSQYTQKAADGQDPSEVVVLTVGDNAVYLDEVNYYALSYATTMGISEDTDLDSAFSEDYPTMDDALKAQFLITLRQTYILYQKAQEADTTLTDDELSEVDELVQTYVDSANQETLDKFGLDDDALTRVFTIYQIVQKFENQLAEDADVEVEEASYGSYYNFVFLTIELDEDGNAVTDDDGNYVYLSDEEQESQKALAEEVRARVLDGEDAETLIEEYDLSSTSNIIYATTESLEETYGLQDGEVSDLLEESFGYLFVQISSLVDDEYSQYVTAYNAQSAAQEYVEEVEQTWFDEFEINDDDIVEDVWEAFTFKDFI